MTGKTLLEVICTSAEDCVRAETAGADRIELCSAIEMGGLTPSYGLIRSALAATSLPVMAMVRPRSGGFCYTESEFTAMLLDVEEFGRLGVRGVVFGILTAVREVDLIRVRALVEAARGMETVFHRAFDVVVDPVQALEDLVSLGVNRVLTSGQQKTAIEGAALIQELVLQANGRIEVLAGSGLNAENLETFVHKTGVRQIHLSGSSTESDHSMTDARLAFNAVTLPENTFRVLNKEKIVGARAVLSSS